MDIKFKQFTLILSFICSLTFVFSNNVNANTYEDIDKSVFGKYAKKEGLDPLLLYAVSLMESARTHRNSDKRKMAAPSQYTLNSGGKAYYFSSKKEAEEKLNELLKTTSNVDIGVMQINAKWHGDKVNQDLSKLFDIDTNVKIGAKILRNAMDSSFDRCLAVGRFHSWNDEARARQYGCKVLSIYNNLIDKLARE